MLTNGSQGSLDYKGRNLLTLNQWGVYFKDIIGENTDIQERWQSFQDWNYKSEK